MDPALSPINAIPHRPLQSARLASPGRGRLTVVKAGPRPGA